MIRDPYKYFRIEARELGSELGRGVLMLERQDRPADVVAGLLRHAHTLKGAARVVKQPGIADLAHAFEDALEPHRTSEVVPREVIDRLLALVDEIGAQVAALPSPEAITARASAATAPSHAAAGDADAAERVRPTEARVAERAKAGSTIEAARAAAVRADVEDVDVLLESIGEAHAQVASMQRDGAALDALARMSDLLAGQLRTRSSAPGSEAVAPRAVALAEELRTVAMALARTMAPALAQTERELRHAREHAERLRLLPVHVVATDLERATRDVAQALGRRARFEAVGADVRLDGHVLGTVARALIQIVRNAVAHGIETPDERVAAGKPAEGLVRLTVRRQGTHVVITCEDDGCGVDVEAVRREATRRGIATRASTGSGDTSDAIALLLEGGISTSASVTTTSGRGVGLDVVREVMARLAGRVAMRTQRGLGTTVELVVPVSIATLETLVVEVSGRTAAIPLDAVRRTLNVAEKDVARTAGGESIVLDGVVVPFRPLARSLRVRARARNAPRNRPAVVIASANELAAIAVDRLVGTGHVLLRPLPDLAPADPVVAGAALDAEGNPQLVLDADALVASARDATLDEITDARATPLPILVVDDSLTTRMLEQSVLESAGYEVELATSAEEALEKVRSTAFGLMLVDVEMPGMDGFTFVATTREDPKLRQVPAILVTSRGAAEDRERGIRAGAVGYIVKSEFDQTDLLERIERLVVRR